MPLLSSGELLIGQKCFGALESPICGLMIMTIRLGPGNKERTLVNTRS
jgi:hypothetical protein